MRSGMGSRGAQHCVPGAICLSEMTTGKQGRQQEGTQSRSPPHKVRGKGEGSVQGPLGQGGETWSRAIPGERTTLPQQLSLPFPPPVCALWVPALEELAAA